MSLRARLLIGMGVVAVVLGAAAVVVTRITEAHLVRRIDQQLDATARRFEGGLGAAVSELSERPPAPGVQTHVDPPIWRKGRPGSSAGAGGSAGGGPLTTAEQPDILSGVSGVWVGTVAENEVTFRVVAGASGAPEGNVRLAAPVIDPGQALAAAETGRPFTVGARGSDDRFRVRSVVNEDTSQVLILSQPLRDVDAAVERLIAVEALATLAVLAVLGLVAWWVLRHGIRPLHRMTLTASAIAGGDLSHRVPRMAPGTEAHQLGVALNQMLGRIEQAFADRTRSERRLRQFVADASHELRTPVTTIRGYSELYETGGLDDAAELTEAMRRTRQEAVRMGNLVDDMLLLARLDQGRPLEQAEVDVAALVRDAGRDARAVDPDRVVLTETEGPLVVRGDADRLRQVIANLVGNALGHTPSSAAVDVRARRHDGWAVIEVVDRGPGMPPEVSRQAFERFFRGDPSRSRHRGGSGLGLSIVQATVLAHGGQVGLASAPGRGTTARVLLPLAPEAEAGAEGSQPVHS